MRSWLLVLAVLAGTVLGGTGLVVPAAPADAASRWRIEARASSGSTVVVKGRAPVRAGTVRLQRRKAGRWVTIKRVTVRRHAFRAAAWAPTGRSRWRAVKGHRASRSVVVVVKKNRPTPRDACGPRPMKANGKRWACTFHDEFNGTTLDKRVWTPWKRKPKGGNGAWACYSDHARNVSVRGGNLRLTARKGTNPSVCGAKAKGTYYTVAAVTTNAFSQKYGRFEARMRNQATTVPGLHEAFWLWPDRRYMLEGLLGLSWPATGEIDVSETYSQHARLTIPFLHYTKDDNKGPKPGLNTQYCAASRGTWNKHTLVWSPSSLSTYINGKHCLTNRSGNAAFRQHYLVQFSQIIGAGTNAVTGRTPFPATLQVDWVRVWR